MPASTLPAGDSSSPTADSAARHTQVEPVASSSAIDNQAEIKALPDDIQTVIVAKPAAVSFNLPTLPPLEAQVQSADPTIATVASHGESDHIQPQSQPESASTMDSFTEAASSLPADPGTDHTAFSGKPDITNDIGQSSTNHAAELVRGETTEDRKNASMLNVFPHQGDLLERAGHADPDPRTFATVRPATSAETVKSETTDEKITD
jgi:hypothetical protein